MKHQSKRVRNQCQVRFHKKYIIFCNEALIVKVKRGFLVKPFLEAEQMIKGRHRTGTGLNRPSTTLSFTFSQKLFNIFKRVNPTFTDLIRQTNFMNKIIKLDHNLMTSSAFNQQLLCIFKQMNTTSIGRLQVM